MSTFSMKILLPATVLSLACLATARADDEQSLPPLDAQHQAWLLERFGEDGIDANGDGVLTHEEAKAFFSEMHKDDDSGWFGRFGQGHHGPGRHQGNKRGPGRRMQPLGRTLYHLEMLDAEEPPDFFTIERHPEADLDGNGELSAEEWWTFAEQRRSEILTRLIERFPDADADGDGTLNANELDAVKAKILARVLERHPEADTDGDGVLSEEEAKALHETRLEERRARILERHPEADIDGDGTLSDVELHQFLGDRPGCGGGFGGHGERHGGKGFGGKGHNGKGVGGKGRGGCGSHP